VIGMCGGLWDVYYGCLYGEEDVGACCNNYEVWSPKEKLASEDSHEL